MFTFLFIQHISPFIMYCLRQLLLFTCKQGCLQTCKYDQSRPVTETYIHTHSLMLIYGFLLELWVLNLKEIKEKNSAHHSPIHL